MLSEICREWGMGAAILWLGILWVTQWLCFCLWLGKMMEWSCFVSFYHDLRVTVRFLLCGLIGRRREQGPAVSIRAACNNFEVLLWMSDQFRTPGTAFFLSQRHPQPQSLGQGQTKSDHRTLIQEIQISSRDFAKSRRVCIECSLQLSWS